MGFGSNSGSTQTAPFGFEVYDEASARGAMKPTDYRSSYLDTGRTRNTFRAPSATSTSSGGGGTGPIPEDVIEDVGRFDLNLFGGVAGTGPPEPPIPTYARGEEPPEEGRLIPEIAKSLGRWAYTLPGTGLFFGATEEDENAQHVGNFFGLFGNVLDAGASLLQPLGNLGTPFYKPGQQLFEELDYYGLADEAKVKTLRAQMDADPAYASRYINEFVEREKYWLAREGLGKPLLTRKPEEIPGMFPWDELEERGIERPDPTPSDPYDVRYAFKDTPSIGGWIGKQLMPFLELQPRYIGRPFAETGLRNTADFLDMDADELERLDAPLADMVKRLKSGELLPEDLPTELSMGGYSFSNDSRVSILLEMLTDPANLMLGSGLAKSVVTGSARRGFAAFALKKFGDDFGQEAVKDLGERAARKAAEDLNNTGKAFDEKTLASRAGSIETKLDVLEKEFPDFYKEALDQTGTTQRTLIKLTPTLDRAATLARYLSDPLEIYFNRGAHVNRVAAFSSASATEGVTWSYNPTNVNRLRTLFTKVDPDGDTAFATLLGRIASNVEAVTHRDSMVNSAIAGGQMPTASALTPTDAARAASEARSNRLAMQVEHTVDRIKTSYISATKRGKKGQQEALEAGRRGARERLIRLLGQDNIDAIDDFLDMKNPAKRDAEEAFALIEHAYYADLIERFAKARTASESLYAADQLAAEAKLAAAKPTRSGGPGKVAKKATSAIKRARSGAAIAARYSLIGPRELTHQRAEKLLGIVNSTAMSDTAKAAAIREAVENYDQLWSSFGARGISDHDLIIDMKLYLEDSISNNALVKAIADEGKLPRPMRDLLREEKAFAKKAGHENYAIGERPADDTLWRPTYSPEDGRLVGLNPWIDVITESAKDYNIGRFSQARQRLIRPIRGQKMVEEAKRQFRLLATDQGLSRREGEQLFSVIRGEASKRGVMPRALRQEEIWQIAKGINIDPATMNRLGERGMARLVTKAFEGNWSTVGVANKLSGAAKGMQLPGNIPLLSGQPGPIIQYISETVYPNVRFRYNPIFNLQEAAEPFFWNILRGVKPGITWSARDLESLESLRRAGLISEFEDQYEYSTNILLGAEAVKQHFGQGTQIGRLWGQTIGEGRKVRSLAEMKRLNHVRQTAQLNGNYFKSAMDNISPGYWDSLVQEVGTHSWGPKVFGIQRIDNTRIANHYWLNKGLYSPDDPGVQRHLMDVHQPYNVGKKAKVVMNDLAPAHGYADTQAFRQAIRDGDYTEAEFTQKAIDFGYDTEYAQRSWRVASGQSPDEFYHSLRMTLRQGGVATTREADEAAKAARKIIRNVARVTGMSEEEFINDAFDGPVRYMNAARHLPKGSRLQATRGIGIDPEVPLAFGAPLREASDPAVQRVVAPYKAEAEAGRLITGPVPKDPTGGLPPTHPDVKAIVPPKRMKVKDRHTVGQKGIDDWKNDGALELGEDGVLRAADEAVFVPSLMLRITEVLPESTMRRLFPDLDSAADARLTMNEEGAQRLLRAWAHMVVEEEMDLGASVHALLSLADSASLRRSAEEAFDDRELWNLLQYGGTREVVTEARPVGISDIVEEVGGETLDDTWRVQNILRSVVDGDVPLANNHQMRAFGYVDDIGIDDLESGVRIPSFARSTDGAAERYGVVAKTRKEASEFDEDIVALRDDYLEDPRSFVNDMTDVYTDGKQTLKDGHRRAIADAIGLDDIEDISDAALMIRLYDDAEAAVGRAGLWKTTRGTDTAFIDEGTIPDSAATRKMLAEHPEYSPVSVMGREQYDYMTRQYMDWANILNDEEYLGRTDWTAAKVAAVDNARYTQFTRGGAKWDIASETRQHQAVIQFDTMPDANTPMATVRPKQSELVEGEEGGLGVVEHELGNWWAPKMEATSGVKVQRVFTSREPKNTRRVYTVDATASDEVLELNGMTRAEVDDGITADIVEEVESAPHRTTYVVTGTPEQIQTALRTTGATLQKDRVSAVSLDLIDMQRDVRAEHVGLRTANRVGKAPQDWGSSVAVDYRIPAGSADDLYDNTFDSLTEMLDVDWADNDFGRMVFQDDNGDTVIRITHDGSATAQQFYNEQQLARLAEFEQAGVTFDVGTVNMLEESVDYADVDSRVRGASRGVDAGDDVRATRDWYQRGRQDPWLQRLDEAGDTDAATAVRDRHRGAAVEQADFLYRQNTPKSYEAKHVVDGDMPAPLRGWKWSHGSKGARGAVHWQADQRAHMYLLKGARPDTVVHEMFHVFVKYIDPSLTEHMLKQYATDNGLKRVPKAWSNASEDYVAEQMVRYMKTGVAPDPNTQTGFNAFAKLIKGAVDDGDLVNPEMSDLLDTFYGRKGATQSATFMADEHRIWNAARSAMSAAEDEAFTTHYFKRGRSFIERSINHPYLGVYPASYMWGKVLPEMIRFLVAKPFGVDAPLWGYAQAVNVWQGINLQLNSDPELREYINENFKEVARFIQMMIPGTPVDMPANFPSYARTLMRGLGENVNKKARGEEPASVTDLAGETVGAFARSVGNTMNPARFLDTGLGIAEEVGDWMNNEDEAPAPPQQGMPLAPPGQ